VLDMGMLWTCRLARASGYRPCAVGFMVPSLVYVSGARGDASSRLARGDR
jgi:hypothetical protein